jgi:hypothetical protein
VTRARSKRSTPARHRRGAQLRLGAWSERELVVDLFAGGGGASEGIARALGRHPDIAINHDPAAIAMHAANHPTTVHFCESVFRVTPREVVGGRPVGLPPGALREGRLTAADVARAWFASAWDARFPRTPWASNAWAWAVDVRRVET